MSNYEKVHVEGQEFSTGLLVPPRNVSALPRYSAAGPVWNLDQILEALKDRQPRREIFGDSWIKNQNGVGACFPAGTLVTLASGELSPIEDIGFGQLVRTHNGNDRQVVDTMSRAYTGDMVTLDVKGWQSLRLTGDHRVWVNDERWIEARDVQPGDEISLVKNSSDGKDALVDVADWVGGELIEDEGKVGRVGSKDFLPRFLVLDEEFCWVLGLYAAEGSTDKNASRLCLTSHRGEVAWRDRAKKFFENLGLTVSISHRCSSLASSLRVSNSVVAHLFEALCGKFANKKRVPTPIATGVGDHKTAFLQGYFAGDGHVGIVKPGSKRTLDKSALQGAVITEQVQAMACTVSEVLARQVATLCVDLGLKPGFGSRKQRDRLQSYNVYLYGNDAARVLRFDYQASNAFQATRTRRDKEFAQLRPVRSVSSEEVTNETVYDFTVDRDHAFIAGGIAVHNCAGYAAASALERARHRAGHDYVELSGDGIYAAVNGGQDRGSMLDDNMQWLSRNGIPPASMVKRHEYRKSRISRDAYVEGERFRGFEAYFLETEIELASALANDFFVAIAVHAGNGGRGPDGMIDWQNGPGNHCVVCDDLQHENGRFEFEFANSWGLRWGNRGRAYVTWRGHLSNPIRYHKFYAIRSATADPEGDNPPTPKG